MPSQKTRSKEDTWTPDELNKALSKTSERRHHRDRDEDRKRDRINGDEKHRRHRDDDSDRRRRHRDEDENGRDRLTEEEREKQREERRRRREGKDGSSSKEKKGRELQFRGKSDNRDIELNDVDENDSDDRRRRPHGDRDRRQRDDGDRERRHHEREQRHRDEDDDRDKRRRHRDDDNDREKRRKHRDDEDDDRERRRKHRDDDEREKRRRHREEEEDERERRRMERRMGREKQEEEERRRKHEEKRERRKDDDRKKDRERDERSDRHRDRKDRDRHKESEREKEERREREREERRREKEEKHRPKEEKKSKRKEEEEKKEEEDDYNYEEDFEDYEEDFEEEEDEDNEEVSRPRNVQLTYTPASKRTTVMNVSLANKESIHKKGQPGSRLDYSDSEVNEVLRALDAENERLLNSSSRSPQVSAKYGRERNHVDSDRGDDSDDGYQKSYQPRTDRPRTAINFVSAKQRAVSRKTASKTMQRGKDLLKMLELDYASFDIMDLPPVNEYDLYIRAFGSSDTRQAYVQTNDDNIDKDIQTEEIDARQKWTQHPPEDFKGCGRGDGEKDVEDEEESQSKQYNREQDLGRLNKFLEKAGQVISILLEESKEEETGSKGQSQTHINVSEGYTQLDIVPILQDRHVIFSHFSPVQPNLLLTVYSPSSQISEENPVSKRGIICVWNTNEPSFPQKILVCSSQPRCCCFSPVKPTLVFAGMVDGSIAMWDLREPMSIHQPTYVNDESYSLRYPTYDTACVLKEENHHSPISSIVPIYSYVDTSKTDASQSQISEDTSSGLSFQLVSTEESAVLHFWVVAEIGMPDIAGSENDLGLAPGAGVKLLKSSSLTLSNQSKDTRLQSGLRALDMSLMPNDPNHFYVATDSGSILHGIRFGKRTFPRAHSPVIDTIVDVVSIDFSPFDQPCFLAGCSDGTFSLYNTKSENPLISWPTITKGKAVQCVRWSRSRPCVFYVLDVTSTLYVFDLLEGDVQPKHIETISNERITSFSLTTVQRPDGLGTSGKEAQMLFSFGDGKTEIHTITKALRVPEQLETDYLGSYLQRF